MLVIVGILLIFGLVVRQKWRNGAAKKEAILRLVAVASEEETEIAKLQVIEGYNSQQQEYNSQHKEYNSQHNNTQLEAQHYCTVCRCPTTTRCSRCKAVRYWWVLSCKCYLWIGDKISMLKIIYYNLFLKLGNLHDVVDTSPVLLCMSDEP